LYEVINEADAVVAHYGDGFDWKYIGTRAIINGMEPPQPAIQIDTYKIAKKRFKFNSNRLSYIGRVLGLGEKMATSDGLWMRCFKGEPAALKEMLAYNKQDVGLLDRVFTRFKPWVPAKVNQALFSAEVRVCPSCGGTHLNVHKHRLTTTRRYTQYQCQDCGAYSSDTKSDEKRAEVK
jgi:predicted RNA-binding Zn-ribbon protein involved in translation (DUF1610 family)